MREDMIAQTPGPSTPIVTNRFAARKGEVIPYELFPRKS